jgi:hypothetical protein
MQSLAGEATAFRRKGNTWYIVLPPASFAVVKVK